MLVALRKVDKTSIDELKTIFKSLDTNGSGILKKEDLLERSFSLQGLQGPKENV
jgi:Ca2+-binding EF-hand superfamily protein